MQGLFREQALDARRQRWLGRIRLPVSRMGTAMAAVAAFALLALAALLYFGRYTRSEPAYGQLQPRGGVLALSAPAAGTLLRSRVDEGQTVRRGQILLEISSELDSPALRGGVGAAVNAELSAQRSRLLADRAALEASAANEAEQWRERIAAAQGRIALAQTQLALREQQAAQTRKLSSQVQPLRGDKLLSDVQWQQYESARIEAETRVQDARRERLDAERELADARAALAAQPRRDEQQRHRIERELADIAQDDARNEGRRLIAVRAPRDGRAVAVAFVAGQSVAAGQRLLSLAPLDAPMQAELWVSDRAVGLIAPGTPVAMRYAGFPYQHYGVQRGKVVAIARGALSAEEIRARTGLPATAPAWRVLVAPDRQSVGARGLSAQMRVDAELQLERRRVYEYLFAPLRPDRADAALRTAGVSP
ncbi:HlyD family efflux transporter periplasmic adaptor subunit [Lysobacter sp. K5869]|uniref:HlyD family secretion protein n=1 Tax=Lysobacter sp. K5869 TaxID=2820808 RepID=UPI001C06020A|nr:HlyD family efflux transporter periplasmic adaptor subunit [Lysobacter sp. K5869]QWP78250.1 HlyD family efflux transporter periplasmic adaptor subunit [Lysobacter sp. K5869]